MYKKESFLKNDLHLSVQSVLRFHFYMELSIDSQILKLLLLVFFFMAYYHTVFITQELSYLIP